MIGYINILKPSGYTSSDVVVRVRRMLSVASGERKLRVGHMGTLDPAGTGVLPIAVGRATRLFDILTYKKKTYRAGIVFGKTTDTLDSYGKITNTCEHIPNLEQLESILVKFRGKISQVPPQYSAISIAGKRAYDYARDGIEVEIKAREVEIFDLQIVEQTDNNAFTLDIICSGGTYIRSLVRDIATELSSLAYMSFIIRLASGEFFIKDSITLDDFELNPLHYLLPIDYVLANYDTVELTYEQYKKLDYGQVVEIDTKINSLFCVKYLGELIGLGEQLNNTLKLRTRLI